MAHVSKIMMRRGFGHLWVKHPHWCRANTRRLHSDLLQLSEEVADALAGHRPVVALESTIITHGMPFPHNLRMAEEVERIVRDTGAVPATVAVLSGKLTVGMTPVQLEELAAPSVDVVKTSRRDLAYVLSQGLTGGTTVSGTMVAAHRAGIPVFVTGGIGGVHRGAETTLDISADLRELGRTPIAVISAGVKSILDIGRTLEYLETEGVCVASYGTSKDFPAFFTPRSGFSAPYNVETSKEAARLIDATLALRLKSGLLIAVPIPEQDTADGDIIEQAIQQAVDEARVKNMQGKEVTPYILQRVNELTSGRSLHANIALVKNNARVGGHIACELALLRSHSSQGQGSNHVKRSFTSCPNQGPDAVFKEDLDEKKYTEKESDDRKIGTIVVIGGTNVDISATVKTEEILTNGATYPGRVRVTFGGVGRNLADALSRLQCTPLFLSAIGVDLYAKMFTTEHTYMDLSAVKRVETHPSALYCALLRNTGELIYGLGDFDIHAQITRSYVKKFEAELTRAPLVCIDGNIPVKTMAYICDVCSRNSVPVWFEPTDIRLAGKPFESDAWRHLAYASPNLNELRVMHARVTGSDVIVDKASSVDGHASDTIDECLVLVSSLLRHIPNIVVTLGKHGVLLCRRGLAATSSFPVRGDPPTTEADEFSFVHYPVGQVPDVVSVSGAGDCLAAGMIANIVTRQSADVCVARGLAAAKLSLLSTRAVPETLNAETVRGDDLPVPVPWPRPEHEAQRV